MMNDHTEVVRALRLCLKNAFKIACSVPSWPEKRKVLTGGRVPSLVLILFVTYVLHSLTRRFSGMEVWVNQDNAVIEPVTGWRVGGKDATDDRLGRLAEVLGESDEGISECRLRMGRGIISAYHLPTEIVRYDTTSFNVHHHPEKGKNGVLEFGHSKNHRPDLLQFKQGLATLDPARMVSYSHAHAQRHEKSFQSRLDKAEEKLSKLRVESKDGADSFRLKAEKILQAYKFEDYLRFEINETITPQKKSIGRGRTGPKTHLEKETIDACLWKHQDEGAKS